MGSNRRGTQDGFRQERSMAKPTFNIGDKVYHYGTQSHGRVEHVFETEEGTRYYINIKRQTWSCPDWALDSEYREFRHKRYQQLSGVKNPSCPGPAPKSNKHPFALRAAAAASKVK